MTLTEEVGVTAAMIGRVWWRQRRREFQKEGVFDHFALSNDSTKQWEDPNVGGNLIMVQHVELEKNHQSVQFWKPRVVPQISTKGISGSLTLRRQCPEGEGTN